MAMTETDLLYDLKGTLLEVCSCNVLCPCWIGEDPDGGTCDAIVAYHFDSGSIQGTDVSGLSLVNVVKIPGNILAGNWKVAMFVNESATDDQKDALIAAYSGQLGGPLADLAGLIGEVVDIRRARITHEIHDGAGTLRIDDFVNAEMAPYRGPDGSVTTLQNTIFSTVPGSPAYASKASANDVNLPEYGMVWSFQQRNAIQSDYHITYAGES
jgi:hypothetical protein